MTVKIAILVCYFLLVLAIGFIARTRWKSSPETYFLADRKLGTLVLLGTMVATNFSAFTVFGTSGAGYRDGYAYKEISDILSIPMGTVKVLIHRGRQELKRAVKREVGEL